MENIIQLGINLQEFKDLLREEINQVLNKQNNKSSDDDELWTNVQTYQFLKISRQTLHQITKRGDINVMKVAGSSVRYWKKDVMEYLERCKG